MINLLHGNLPASLNPVKQLRPLTKDEFVDKLRFFALLMDNSITAYEKARDENIKALLSVTNYQDNQTKKAVIEGVLKTLLADKRLSKAQEPYALWAYAWALCHKHYHDTNDSKFHYYAQFALLLYPAGGNNG